MVEAIGAARLAASGPDSIRQFRAGTDPDRLNPRHSLASHGRAEPTVDADSDLCAIFSDALGTGLASDHCECRLAAALAVDSRQLQAGTGAEPARESGLRLFS